MTCLWWQRNAQSELCLALRMGGGGEGGHACCVARGGRGGGAAVLSGSSNEMRLAHMPRHCPHGADSGDSGLHLAIRRRRGAAISGGSGRRRRPPTASLALGASVCCDVWARSVCFRSARCVPSSSAPWTVDSCLCLVYYIRRTSRWTAVQVARPHKSHEMPHSHSRRLLPAVQAQPSSAWRTKID